VLRGCIRAVRLCTCLWMFTHTGHCDSTTLGEHLPYRQCSRRKTHVAAQKDLRERSLEAVSAILCFDLLPLWRSHHLTVIVCQAARVLFSPAILVRVFLNHILRGET